jgi:hypothetical protein
METFGIATVAAITLICFCVGEIIKSTEFISNKYIPAIVLILGAILGGVGMRVIPDYPATDIINAIAVGFASGGTATAIDQAKKQLSKDE